jgi:hypothetical protein
MLLAGQRTILIHAGLPTVERFRILCEGLQALGESALLKACGHSPEAARPPSQSADTEAMAAIECVPHVETRDRVTLRELPAVPKTTDTPFGGQLAAPRCELCDAAAYAIVLGITFCRHHLYLSANAQLEAAEVRLLRQRHGQHPELAFERYDGRGRRRQESLARATTESAGNARPASSQIAKTTKSPALVAWAEAGSQQAGVDALELRPPTPPPPAWRRDDASRPRCQQATRSLIDWRRPNAVGS